MGFSLKSFFGCLFCISVPFSLQSFCNGNSVTNLASISKVMMNVFWFVLIGSRFSNADTLTLGYDKKSSIFNSVLG